VGARSSGRIGRWASARSSNFKLCVPTLENPLVLRGKVQWTVIPEEVVDDGEPGMGIGFVYGSESERERIEGHRGDPDGRQPGKRHLRKAHGQATARQLAPREVAEPEPVATR
jgi:hypothetical protein